MHIFASHSALAEREQDERQLALAYIADAFNAAEADGLEGSALAHAALFAAFATLVKEFGEEAAAKLAQQLPERILHGEYTIDRTIQ